MRLGVGLNGREDTNIQGLIVLGGFETSCKQKLESVLAMQCGYFLKGPKI